ncbi:MAG: plastocyanin/azurin family copper-binding protein [Actinomycetota bacterium]
MTRRRLRALLGAAGLSLGFAACGPDGPDAGGAAPQISAESPRQAPDSAHSSVAATGERVTVRALDNVFRNETTVIAAGTTVEWRNGGRTEHDVIPVDRDQLWGVPTTDFQPGTAYEHTFTEPGVYRYYCSIHGTADVGMIGTIEVTG